MASTARWGLKRRSHQRLQIGIRAGMASTARWRAGNNVGVESGRVDVVFVDRPVMLLVPLLPAHGEQPERPFLPQQGAHISCVASTRAHERSLTRHTTAREVC